MRSNKALIVLGGLILAASLLLSLYHLAYHNKIYPRVFAAGREISNLTLEAAEQTIASQLPETLPELNLTFGSQTWPLDLASWEISYQAGVTAQNAYLFGRSNGFFGDLMSKWQRWWRPEALAVQFTYNESRFNENIEAIIKTVTEPVIEPSLELQTDGSIKLIPGKNGRTVEKERLASQILNQIGNLNFNPVEVPVIIVSAAVDQEQLTLVQEKAELVKNKSLKLTYEEWAVTVKGQELIDLIDWSGNWSEAEIASLSARVAGKIDRSAQDAVFQFDGNKVFAFKPALPGIELDQEASGVLIAAGLDQLINEEAAEQTAALVVTTSVPKISTESVNDLGIKELIGKGESTFHGSIASREHNVALTAGRLNGTIVAPGEVFSFNQTVGDISLATGYQSAYIIKDGRTILGDGGGVCQDSTTMFRAALNAGLEIVERHPHSYRVSYYEQNSPVGVDATVYSPSTDFKFRNDTPGHILIQTQVDLAKNYLKIEIYGTSDGRKAVLSNFRLWGQTPPPADLYVDDPTLPSGQIKQIDWKASGAKAAFDWTVTRKGETIQQKTFYSSYQPWQAVFLRGTAI